MNKVLLIKSISLPLLILSNICLYWHLNSDPIDQLLRFAYNKPINIPLLVVPLISIFIVYLIFFIDISLLISPSQTSIKKGQSEHTETISQDIFSRAIEGETPSSLISTELKENAISEYQPQEKPHDYINDLNQESTVKTENTVSDPILGLIHNANDTLIKKKENKTELDPDQKGMAIEKVLEESDLEQEKQEEVKVPEEGIESVNLELNNSKDIFSPEVYALLYGRMGELLRQEFNLDEGDRKEVLMELQNQQYPESINGSVEQLVNILIKQEMDFNNAKAVAFNIQEENALLKNNLSEQKHRMKARMMFAATNQLQMDIISKS